MSLHDIWAGILDTSVWEWCAIGTSVMYVLLAANEIRACWYFAFLSSSIYIYLCFSTQLYMESLLQVFYVAMAVYGWMKWRESENSNRKIHYQPWKWTIVLLLVILLISILIGFFLDQNTNQASPYLDAGITLFSIYATFLVAKKAIENWILFVVIDVLSIYLYASRGLESSALLYVFFTFAALYGWINWHQIQQKSKESISHN